MTYIIPVEIKGNDTNFTRLSLTEAFLSHNLHTALKPPLLPDIPCKPLLKRLELSDSIRTEGIRRMLVAYISKGLRVIYVYGSGAEFGSICSKNATGTISLIQLGKDILLYNQK